MVLTTAHGRGTVDLDVGNIQSFGFKTLDLSIALSVGQQVEHMSDGLLGPATGNGLVSFGLGVVTDTSHVTEERNGIFALKDIFKKALSSLEGQTLQVVGSVQGVLVVNTKI